MSKLELRPSESLMSLMQQAANTLTNFGKLWADIKEMGNSEGFTDKELQEILRPLLKPQLSKDQIYYLFNSEQQKERAQNYRNVTKVNHKNDIEESDILDESTPRPLAYQQEQAVDVVAENEQLRKQNNQLKDALAKKSIVNAEDEAKNFETIFEMLPNDDVDTFKNKSGTLMLLERVLVNLKHQDVHKRLKYQWWVRVIK